MRRARIIAGAAGFTVGVLSGVVVWGIAAGKNTDWWAAWGQWVGGIGTIFAVGVALWIAHRDWRLAHAEQADRDKAQARLVSGELPGIDFARERLEVVTSGAERPFVIFNRSTEQPIYRAEFLHIRLPGEPTPDPRTGLSAHAVRPVTVDAGSYHRVSSETR